MTADSAYPNPPSDLALNERGQQFEELLRQRIVVLDGSQGVYLQGQGLTAADFGGEQYEGCNEYLVVTRPDVIEKMHRAYYAAGSDVVGTNSFGSTPLVLGEYDLADRAEEISATAAGLARKVAAEFDGARFVSGSMGPTTKAISVTGGITFDELIEHYHIQARGLLKGGVDLLLLETIQDTRNAKAGILGTWAAMRDLGFRVPLLISGTIEPMGTMLAGQGVEAFYASVEHSGMTSIGLNCATGPEFMTDHIRTLAATSSSYISCYPNAGLPDEFGKYSETPELMAETLGRFVENGWLNLVGGCCGTTPEYIRQIAEVAHAGKPRQLPTGARVTHVSGIEYVECEESSRPLIIGERTNMTGSRKFRRLIENEQFEEAAEVARAQVRAGAQLIDINLDSTERNPSADMEQFLGLVTRMVKVPLVIDSTNPAVYAAALPYCQGKSILNSINLEDGEKRFEAVTPLARRFGAALVVGCLDEVGQRITAEEKVDVAERSFRLLTEKYGIPAQDIIWDALAFPCATGDENYRGSALHTINAVRELKARFPGTRTVLGISNVSFGLPEAGREVLNAVCLYHATKAGLDFAIVSSEKLVRYASIPGDEKKLCDDLLFRGSDEDIAAFTAHFRERKPQQEVEIEKLPLDERIASYIVQGTKEGLIPDLEEKRVKEGVAPLDIINGPLMAGMDEVGRLFANNELIVAEVLQSAEAMKAAVAHLEPFMEKTAAASKGKLLLATVKGDVHDIGKNLVEIILANNGYEVVNLGIKVAPETLIAAVKEQKPDFIGLSGLLVKSAQQMVVTAEDLKAAGVDVPMLVGGAALTPNFTYRRILPTYQTLVIYAKDAMEGLELANKLQKPEGRAELERMVKERAARLVELAEKTPRITAIAGTTRSSQVDVVPVREAPDLARHELAVRLHEVWPYLNLQMLYGKHLGLAGNVKQAIAARDPKYLALAQTVEDAMKRAEGGWMRARGVFQYFLANSDGNDLILYDSTGKDAARFNFLRQPSGDELCLADYVAPTGGDHDSVAMFVTSCGAGIRQLTQKLKEDGEYVLSHTLQALAIETAEAFAEKLHHDLRRSWGIQDPPDFTMDDIHKARYQGIRVSFGYPACPNLADQEILWKVLRPETIGVELTEGYMMDPEASVSALVFHHPQARYFGVGVTDEAELQPA
jgi:5-methyltetrahydrofolate--homocysteine methyltransferase